MTCNAHISARIMIMVECLAFAVMAMLLSPYFVAADCIQIVAGLAVAYAIPRMVYCRMRCHHRGGDVTLMVGGLFLAALAAYLIYSWTAACGFSLELPELKSDDRVYFKWALFHYNGTCEEVDTKFIGLPLMILASWKVLGISIVWPIAINMLATLLTVVVIGQTAARILEIRTNADGAVIAACAMALTIVLGYFMSQGVKLQKEALSYLSVALGAYSVARMACTDNGRWTGTLTDCVIFAIALLIGAMVRLSLGYFFFIGIGLAWIGRRGEWRYAMALTGIALIAMGIGMYFATDFALDRQARVVVSAYNGSGVMGETYPMSGSQQAYGDLIGSYFSYPLWKRVLLLPLTAAVQFVVPFPWITAAEPVTFSSIAPRQQIGWYMVGLVTLYYYVALSWRKGRRLPPLAWWPLLCFLATAFLSGGAVSRYALPFEPLFAIVATYTLLSQKHKTK